MESEYMTLYIPMGVKTEPEFFAGFGKKQMAQSAVGSLCGGLLALIIWLITASVAFTVVVVLAGIAGSVMMTAKDQSNQSVVDQVSNMLRFSRSQKIYPYRYGKEWEGIL